jgi:hypothetical protein
MMQACTIAAGQVVVTASGRPAQSVADGDAHVFDAAVLDLGQHREPELRALPAIAGPQPEDVALTAAGDSDRHVDRAVHDLPVADLDHDGVDEHHRIDPIQRPVAPLTHLLHHRVGDPADGVLADGRAIDVGEVRRRSRQS